MGRYDKAIANALCKLQNGNDNTSTDYTDKLDSIISLLTQILDLPQIEGLDPISYCDDEGITGFVAYILDEETNAVTPLYFDANGLSTTTAPLGTPCKQEDGEFKFFEKEVCLTDGTKGIEVLCIYYINGVQESVSTFWIVNGVQVTTDPGVVECIECLPLVESFKGNNATLEEFNEIELFIPKCCEVTITTSAGSFTLPSYRGNWGYVKTFNCVVSDFEITSTCDINDITIILTKTN